MATKRQWMITKPRNRETTKSGSQEKNFGFVVSWFRGFVISWFRDFVVSCSCYPSLG